MKAPQAEIKNPAANPIINVTILFIGVVSLFLAVLKAYHSPFTHDESLSYNVYAGYSVPDIISYVNTYGLTNNHILNTLLLKLCGAFFGNSPLGLRLPNLISFAVYLYLCYRLLRRLQSPLLLLGGFLLLSSNLFVNDFFALARGYGLANSLLLAAIFQLFSSIEKPGIQKNIAVMGFSGLAILANFTLLHIAITIVALHSFFRIQQQRPQTLRLYLKTLRFALWFILIMGAILYEPFRTIIKWDTTFGGYDTFWNSAVKGLLIVTIYVPAHVKWLATAEVITAAVTIIVSIIILNSCRQKKYSDAFIYLILLIIPSFLFIAQHLLMGSAYPVNRTVQYMIPVFVLLTISSVQLLPTLRKIPAYLLLCIGIFGSYYFIKHYSMRVYGEWENDASNAAVIKDLEQLRQGQNVVLAINWLCEPGLNFERNRRAAIWLQPLDRRGLNIRADYYYGLASDTATLAAQGRKLIRQYPLSKTYLYK